MPLNINDIQTQLVANADEIKAALATKRTERDTINEEIRELVSQEKKAERLAAVVRRELAKQADVASVAPATLPEEVAV
jgi:uncharacterized protein (UPF0264 family)